jgi:GT2 family glycosyltransferase
VGVVGPQLLNADGSVQSSRRSFPTLWTAVFESTWLQPLAPKRVMDRYYVREAADDAVTPVDWVQGAAFVVRREATDVVGLFDEQFFMYSEELDWQRRIQEAGWKVVYLPTAKVLHHGGKSSDQVVAKRHIYFQSSKVRYFRKHHGIVAGEFVRLVLLLNYVSQLGLEAAKWLIGYKRALRRDRVAAYWQVLRSGLRG